VSAVSAVAAVVVRASALTCPSPIQTGRVTPFWRTDVTSPSALADSILYGRSAPAGQPVTCVLPTVPPDRRWVCHSGSAVLSAWVYVTTVEPYVPTYRCRAGTSMYVLVPPAGSNSRTRPALVGPVPSAAMTSEPAPYVAPSSGPSASLYTGVVVPVYVLRKWPRPSSYRR
jgi:hypothetical protein